ncbi:MAG: sigma 54-interacting transcriptional regulator [Deltaproteobacteria bacterium]|nr:sigma 54-interacting transcriptional regulator [Deltaproteobacteria bacterium]
MGLSNPVLHEQFRNENESLLGARQPVEREQEGNENLHELFPEIVFQSREMYRLLKTVLKISRSHGAVLILGESGTGKELIASAIHRLSPRAHKCFTAINCSAIPENLLEAELFGHEKGAFTGADRRRAGLFASAHEGTIFLDEIGDMPLRLQAKLLRVLQEKKFTPVGGREAVHADIRIISATNIDLEQAVQSQNFRLDLYYRLNVLPVKIPALRERKEDITLLLDHFTEQSNREHPQMNTAWIDPEAKQLLQHYRWPGNIRQLQNLVERLTVIHSGGRLGIDQLPDEFRPLNSSSVAYISEDTPAEPRATERSSGQEAFPEQEDPSLSATALVSRFLKKGFRLNEFIAVLENSFISEALRLTRNNKNQAARLLGLNRTTLVERIKKRKIGSSSESSGDVFGQTESMETSHGFGFFP